MKLEEKSEIRNISTNPHRITETTPTQVSCYILLSYLSEEFSVTMTAQHSEAARIILFICN